MISLHLHRAEFLKLCYARCRNLFEHFNSILKLLLFHHITSISNVPWLSFQLTDFNYFLVWIILRKTYMNILLICPPHLPDVATLPGKIQSHFSVELLINSSNYLRYLGRKQIATVVLQLNCLLTADYCLLSSIALLLRLVPSEWWGAGVVICLERGADLHMAQLMPLPLAVSCFSKIQIGFTFLVLAHPGSPGKKAIKRGGGVCVDWDTDWPMLIISFPS